MVHHAAAPGPQMTAGITTTWAFASFPPLNRGPILQANRFLLQSQNLAGILHTGGMP